MGTSHLFHPLEPRRFLDAGELDTTFGAGGHTELPFAGEFGLHDFDAVPGGQLIVTARTYDGPDGPSEERDPDAYNIRLWRLAPDGSRDEDFGADPTGEIVLHVSPTVAEDQGWGIVPASTNTAVYADGSFLVQIGNLLYKYNPHGRPDRSFGKNGRAIAHAFNRDKAMAAAVDLEGRIYVAGAHEDGWMAIARLGANGKPDLSFGDGGVMRFDGVRPELEGFRTFAAERIADGSIMVNVIARGTAETGEFFHPTYDGF